MWEAIIERYWKVATFRETPANTPCSWLLLLAAFLLYYVIILFQWSIFYEKQAIGHPHPFLAGLSLLGANALYTFLLLNLRNKIHRLIQTMSSLVASSLIIHVFAFPLMLINATMAPTVANQPILLLVAIFYLLLTLTLSIWQFLVIAFIYKEALEISSLKSYMASFGFLAFNILSVSFWQ